MATNSPLPAAEAKIQFRPAGGVWRDSIDLDPTTLPVEVTGRGGEPLATDVFDSRVIDIVDALIVMDLEADGPSYRLVWSVNGHDVRGTCPVCDDVFIVAEGVPGDELNEGYEAVCCGCDPEDVDDED